MAGRRGWMRANARAKNGSSTCESDPPQAACFHGHRGRGLGGKCGGGVRCFNRTGEELFSNGWRGRLGFGCSVRRNRMRQRDCNSRHCRLVRVDWDREQVATAYFWIPSRYVRRRRPLLLECRNSTHELGSGHAMLDPRPVAGGSLFFGAPRKVFLWG